MDILDLTDKLWFKIAPIFSWISESLGAIFYPFILLGPVIGIACIAAVTYGITKIISKLYKSAKLERLQGEFDKLKEMKKGARQMGDKKVSKGIDDEMDRIYFDIFFTSIQRGLLTISIPMMAMLCWVWSYFSPERLQSMCGKPYVIKLPFKIGIYDYIGPAFWFVISLICVWGIYTLFSKMKRKETKGVPVTSSPGN